MGAMTDVIHGTPHVEPTDTRSAILEETIRIIDAHGEAAVRVRDVVAAAGVATTSMYHFFGGREDLIDAANAERYRRTLYGPNYGEFEDMVGGCDTEEKLKAALLHGIGIARNEVGAGNRRVRVMVLGSAQSRPNLAARITQINTDYVERTARLFEHAIDMGWARPGFDAKSGALWYLGQMTGRVLLDLGGVPATQEGWENTEAVALLAVIFGDPS